MIAGILFSFAFFPYFKSIYDGKKPNRATWLIWSLVGALILFSYKAGGAESTVWTTYAGALLPFPIFVLSIWWGEGGFEKIDLMSIAVALFGTWLWWITTNPVLGLVIFLGIDMVGIVPTIRKVAKDPQSEHVLPWLLWTLGNATNLAAVEEWSWSTWHIPLYPLCYLAGTATVVLLVLRRHLQSALLSMFTNRP
jgi:hypothetical protein